MDCKLFLTTAIDVGVTAQLQVLEVLLGGQEILLLLLLVVHLTVDGRGILIVIHLLLLLLLHQECGMVVMH